MAAIANTGLTDTFDNWRIRTNQVVFRMNQIAVDESSIFSNTVTANLQLTVSRDANVGNVFTVDSGSANTNIYSDTLSVTANSTLKGSNTNVTGTANVDGRFTVSSGSSNTNIFSDHFNLTSNSNISSANLYVTSANAVFTGHVNFTGNNNVVGLNTSNTEIAGAINEVKVTADAAGGDALAFAIALG